MSGARKRVQFDNSRLNLRI